MTAPAGHVPDPAPVIERGLAVFPLPPGARRPAIRGWQHECITDPALTRQLWTPGDNVGVGCRASDLVGIDLDRCTGPDGITAFAALCATYGRTWPHTLTVRTPRGGLHLYFRAPPGRIFPSTSGRRAGLGPGIDIRGPGRSRGGYLVGPDSIVDGTVYVVTYDTGIQELPSWLAGLIGFPDMQPAESDPG